MAQAEGGMGTTDYGLLMSEKNKITVRLTSPDHRENAIRAIRQAPDGYLVTIQEETRTSEQNRKLWPMLEDFSEQVEHAGHSFSREEWKDLLTAAFRQAEVVPGLDGAMVALGLSTSNMGKREFSAFIEFIYSEGAERGVIWSEPALAVYAEYREAAGA